MVYCTMIGIYIIMNHLASKDLTKEPAEIEL